MKNFWKVAILKVIIIFAIIALDIITKQVFYNTTDATIIPFLIGVRKAYQLNTGGAYGIFSGNVLLLTIFTVLLIAIAICYDLFSKSKGKLYTIAFSFILGGAIGNLIDRVFLGGVRDFIFFEFYKTFPTFNLADSFLMVGMILFAIYVLFFYTRSTNKEEGNKLGK